MWLYYVEADYDNHDLVYLWLQWIYRGEEMYIQFKIIERTPRYLKLKGIDDFPYYASENETGNKFPHQIQFICPGWSGGWFTSIGDLDELEYPYFAYND